MPPFEDRYPHRHPDRRAPSSLPRHLRRRSESRPPPPPPRPPPPPPHTPPPPPPPSPPPPTPIPVIRFQFDRPGLPIPRFRIEIREDGQGIYHAEPGPPPTPTGARISFDPPAKVVDRTFQLPPALTGKIYRDAGDARHFRVPCASRAKNIADTGTKTLTYEGPDGTFACTYNYSEIKQITALTETFLALSTTLDEGRRIEFMHRYDRLGLDAEVGQFEHTVADGRALGVSVIAPTLQALVDDEDLMQRVRQRAARLLEVSQLSSPTPNTSLR